MRFIVLFLLLSGVASGQTISSVTGAVSHDGSIVISGSSFGTKATAAPLKWDDFEDGADGNTLVSVDATWIVYGHGGIVYSNSEAHSGSLSLEQPTPGDEFKTNYITFPTPSDEMYCSYWFKTTNFGGSDAANMKLVRLTSSVAAGGGGVYNGEGNLTLARYGQGGNSEVLVVFDAGTGGERRPVPADSWLDLPHSTWVRVDAYKKVSTPGVSDGAIYAATIGQEVVENYELDTTEEGFSYQHDTVWMGNVISNPTVGTEFEIYLDDMYIDNTLSRVELGDNATFASCTHREIQIPSAWAAGEVTITVNTGTFATDASAYLFVVDSDGTASAGYAVIIGESGGGAPGSPGTGTGCGTLTATIP